MRFCLVSGIFGIFGPLLKKALSLLYFAFVQCQEHSTLDMIFVGAPSTEDVLSFELKHHYQKESLRFIVLFAWDEKDKALADREMRKSG